MKSILAILVIIFCPYVANAVPISPSDAGILRVGIIPSTEPFIMQASSKEYYGFDIATMDIICKKINKTCTYSPIKRSQVLSSFDNYEIDVAIGDFVISAKMQQYFDFSMPYMISQAQFISLKSNASEALDLDKVRKMRIGVIINSAYEVALIGMNIPSNQIKTFETDNDIIAAIETGQIDVGFMNNYIANYWEQNSGGVISSIGSPINVGFGLALVLSKDKLELLNAINVAIYKYQNSPDFKNNYNTYLRGLEY